MYYLRNNYFINEEYNVSYAMIFEICLYMKINITVNVRKYKSRQKKSKKFE